MAEFFTTSTVTLAFIVSGDEAPGETPLAELKIGDEPLLRYLLGRFQWDGPTLLITAPGREHPPGYDAFSAEVVDPLGEGSLRGVIAAVESATTPVVAIMPLYLPHMHHRFVRWMVDELYQQPQCVGLMCRRGVGGAHRVESMPIVLRKRATPLLRRLLAGGRSIYRLAADPNFATIFLSPDWSEKIWTNIGDPEERAAFIAEMEDSAEPPMET